MTDHSTAHHLFDIKTLTDDTCVTNVSAIPGQYTVYEIYWFTKGSGTLVIDVEEYPVTRGIVYCMHPGQLYKIKNGTEIEGYHLSFSPSFININDRDCCSFFNNMPGQQQVKPFIVTKESWPQLQLLANQLVWEYQHCCRGKMGLLWALLKVFLVRLSLFLDEEVSSARTADTDVVKRFSSLVSLNYINMKKV